MQKKRDYKKVINIVLIVLAVFVVYWVVSPIFIDKKVNEDLPLGDIHMGMEGIEDTGNMGMVGMEGMFSDADSFHKTSGNAKIIEDSGSKYLRFENFETTNGPDLYVYLATDNSAGDYVSLGRLKGNVGNQNYEIPGDVDLNKYDKVLIWCKAFGVLFGEADLN